MYTVPQQAQNTPAPTHLNSLKYRSYRNLTDQQLYYMLYNGPQPHPIQHGRVVSLLLQTLVDVRVESHQEVRSLDRAMA